MTLQIFATTWGLEDLNYEEQFKKIADAGYHGVETGRIKPSEINQVLELLEKYNLLLICQQWTEGESPEAHLESFKKQAEINARLNPILINSHTGKDYFSFEGNLELLKKISAFEQTLKTPVVHETHRGRFAFAAHATYQFLKALPNLKLTADYSHWCCVAESLLEDQKGHLQEAIAHSFHLHARIGSSQASQVNNPESPEWDYEKQVFLGWWQDIIKKQNTTKGVFPITCEFGPNPYMPTAPFTAKPLASQWEANLYMKSFLEQNL